MFYIGQKLQILTSLNKTSNTIKANIRAISNALIDSETVEWDGRYLKDYSPLTLTQEGIEYLKQTNFIDVFEQHENDVFDYIIQESPQTKYDVENASVTSVLSLADEEYMEPVKVYLYNHPKDSMSKLAKIAGVYVRDKYLAAHPDIKE